MKRRGLKSIILVMIICIPYFLMSINTYIDSNSTKRYNEIDDRVNLKTSATFDGTEINDLPGSLNNWSWAKSQGICTGSGTQLDPYIIDGHIFHPTVVWDCLRILHSKEYFTITNCEFRYAPSIYSGIFLRNSTNGRILNNDFYGCKYGIYGYHMNDTLISENNIYSNYGDGIFITSGHGNIIINNNLTLNGWQGMWMEFSANNIISGNKVNANNLSGIYLLECDYSTVDGNMLNHNLFSGLTIYNNTFATIENNEIKENNREGLYFYGNLDSGITGNTIHGNLLDGIFITDSHGNSITNNNLSSNGFQGMWMEYSSNNIISENLVHNNNYSGIYLYECDYSTVNDNMLNFNVFSGLRIHYNIFTTIENNEMKENIREGMYFRSNLNCSIIKNNIKNNTWDGIFARFSNGTVITENIFINNGISGLRFDASCQLNKIYLNCFNNLVNAIDDGFNNQWDNGIKGNYWADYTGVDSNINGIGDTPYNITGSAGSQDRFPLIICPLIEDVEAIPSFDLYIVISVIIFSVSIIWLIKRKKLHKIHF